MSRIQDPPWKKRTRPCPFFSRGTCLFAEQCNFIHTVKSPVAPEILITDVQDSIDSTKRRYSYTLREDQIVVATPVTPPNVTSPPFDESPPPSHSDAFKAPIPIPWHAARPPSWESFHSAASNITYPTDRTATDSRSSSPQIDPYALAEVINDQNDNRAHAHDVDEEDVPQEIDAKRYSLGQPFTLSPPKPRKERRPTSLSKIPAVFFPPEEGSEDHFVAQTLHENHDPHDDDDNPQGSLHPGFLQDSLGLSPISPETQQIPLQDVLLKFSAFGSTPRREASAAKAATSETIDTASSKRPPVFQGGDRHSYAFREHLEKLMSTRSNMIQRPRNPGVMSLPDPPPIITQPPIPSLVPKLLSLPTGPVVPLTLANLASHTANLSPLSPEHFKRPIRPSRNKPGNNKERRPPAPRVPTRIEELPSPLDIFDSPFTPDAETPSYFNGPFTDSPEDFRNRKSTAPLNIHHVTALIVPPPEDDGDDPLDDDDTKTDSSLLGGYSEASPMKDVSSHPPADDSTPLASRTLNSPVAAAEPSIIVPVVQEAPRSPSPTPASRRGSHHVLESIPSLLPTSPPPVADALPSSWLKPLRLSMIVAGMAAGLQSAIVSTPERRGSSVSSVSDHIPEEDEEEDSTPIPPPDRPTQPSVPSPSPISRTNKVKSSQSSSIIYRSPQKPAHDTSLFPRFIPINNSTSPLSFASSQELPPLTTHHKTSQSPQRPRHQASIAPSDQSTLRSNTIRGERPTPVILTEPPPLIFPRRDSHAPSLIGITESIVESSTRSRNPSRSSSPLRLNIARNDTIPAIPISQKTPVLLPSPIIHSPPASIPLPAFVGHRRKASSIVSHGSAHSRTSSAVVPPRLFFAIASDNPEEVRRLLATSQANANDRAGPEDEPALAFVMGNDQLKNKLEMVKILLEYGADPSVLNSAKPPSGEGDDAGKVASPVEGDGEADDETRRDSMITIKGPPKPPETIDSANAHRLSSNPAIDYYLSRTAEIPQRQLEMLRSAGFDPLARMPFHMIGQDMVLNELLRVLANHSRRAEPSPISVIFAGPSGHGKSMLSHNIGDLLQLPAHTINMTNLRSQEELLQARSLSNSPANMSLAEFLSLHEGKRCVVILEEIEKVADKSTTNTLLMPWELGKLNTPSRLYDTSRVVWIATSNAGEDAVFKFLEDFDDQPYQRRDYLDLSTKIRRSLIGTLGASLVSRITTVLPFLAFTTVEKRAIAYQFLTSLNSQEPLPKPEMEELLAKVLEDYIPSEGVRSIQRSVQMRLEEDAW